MYTTFFFIAYVLPNKKIKLKRVFFGKTDLVNRQARKVQICLLASHEFKI